MGQKRAFSMLSAGWRRAPRVIRAALLALSDAFHVRVCFLPNFVEPTNVPGRSMRLRSPASQIVSDAPTDRPGDTDTGGWGPGWRHPYREA